MSTPSPMNGNAVLTTTTLTFIVGAVIVLLRAYGYQITGDQENALITALQGPLGEVIIAAALWIGAWISRSKVWSQLSVEGLRQGPTVHASGPGSHVYMDEATADAWDRIKPTLP